MELLIEAAFSFAYLAGVAFTTSLMYLFEVIDEFNKLLTNQG